MARPVVGAQTDDKESQPLLAAVVEDFKKPRSDQSELETGLQGAVAGPRTHFCGLPVQAVAGLSYCTASAGMVLVNKLALSSFNFTAPISLLLFQCIFCATAVQLSAAAGLVDVEGWNTAVATAWLPINAIFTAMLYTSFTSLQLLTVPMVSVLKNLTNLFTICGDMYFFQRSFGFSVWLTLLLMAVSAVCGALTDISFSLRGYAWQIINCVFTASYSLALRSTMDKVVPLTKGKRGLSEISMVFYNNLLSIPFLVMLAAAQGEMQTLHTQPALQNPYFIAAACTSAVCGFLISFCSLWFLSTTSATTFSLVGSLNKIPVAVIGLVAFEATWSVNNIASVLVGLLAGVIFVRAKATGAK